MNTGGMSQGQIVAVVSAVALIVSLFLTWGSVGDVPDVPDVPIVAWALTRGSSIRSILAWR